jgi:uncharacterized protein
MIHMTENISINFAAVWDHVIKELQCDPNSIHGPGHWRRVEQNALNIAASNGAIVEVVELLQKACSWHTRGKLSEDPTIGACWDADRLDLTRIGETPKARFMSTALGRSLCSQE